MLDSIGSVGPYVPQPAQGAGKPVFTQPTAPEHKFNESQNATAAIFHSPAISVDPATHIVIYEQRDTTTGEVINQYPSKKIVDAYRQASEGVATPGNIAAAATFTGSSELATLAKTQAPEAVKEDAAPAKEEPEPAKAKAPVAEATPKPVKPA